MSEQNKTLQQKMDALADLIAWFDGDEFILEEAVEQFKKAETLASEIEKDLSSIKNEIIVLRQKFDSGE